MAGADVKGVRRVRPSYLRCFGARCASALASLAVSGAAIAAEPPAQAREYDLLIRGGRAVEAARASGGRVMVDLGHHVPELSLRDLLLTHLRPGDIFTHVYADIPGRTTVVDESGRVRPYVLEAARRGVVFDLGHGGGSFVFDQAVPALAQGLLPGAISTDMHLQSLNGAMGDMVNVVSKMLNLGMSLPDLVRRSTAAPAAIIGRPELGTLGERAAADIAVLRLETGRYGYVDTRGARIDGDRRLECAMTVRDGRVLWDRDGLNARRYVPR